MGKGKNQIRDAKEVYKRLKENGNEIYSKYGSPNMQFQSRAGNKQEFWGKKIRQMYLLEGCFQSQKHIIPVKRLRNPEDSMMSLRKNGEIAITIEGREEFNDFHFVAELKELDKLHLYFMG
jgi:hypothetical protein